eukprot:scaffold481349_cov28-Prasinocladus_malaysianus.AAC.1
MPSVFASAAKKRVLLKPDAAFVFDETVGSSKDTPWRPPGRGICSHAGVNNSRNFDNTHAHVSLVLPLQSIERSHVRAINQGLFRPSTRAINADSRSSHCQANSPPTA